MAVTEPGLYYVTVSTGAGCVSSDSIEVKVSLACNDVWFPSAISADGNTKNNLFGPSGNVSAIKKYSLRIYNRYGELVFETADPYARWDGTFKKGRHTVNNFVWLAAYEFNGLMRHKKGNLVVIK